jgi:pimeloyl-ACP methyl ester carboxylesterase
MSPDESRWALIDLRRVTIDGDRIAFRVSGQGPVLLLVHGMAGSSETWKHVMPALAERFTVLAPDLLGQGQSDEPRGEYSLALTRICCAICWTRSATSVPPSSGSPSGAAWPCCSRISSRSVASAWSWSTPAGWAAR